MPDWLPSKVKKQNTILPVFWPPVLAYYSHCLVATAEFYGAVIPAIDDSAGPAGICPRDTALLVFIQLETSRKQ